MNLLDEIRIAQRNAGEDAVIRHLEAQGLGAKPDAEEQKADTHFLQPKIAGYRQLLAEEVALMNEGKALAEQCGAYIAKLRSYVPENGDRPTIAPGGSLDQRWISLGATDLQRGFMAVIRGIAQPTTF